MPSEEEALKPRSKFQRWTYRVVLILLALFALVMVSWAVVAGPVTVFRVIRYGDTNIDDFSHYPGRPLRPAETPSQFLQSDGTLELSGSVVFSYQNTDQLIDEIEANDTIALLIIKEEQILLERYFQDHTQDALSQSFSMGKSFTSALIGLAIADGYMEGVHQPITEFVPELAGRGFNQVELRHLLTMTSGSSYVENDNPFGEHVILNYTPDLRGEILSFRMAGEPGESFRYKSGDNALLALALDRALGDETITEYTQRKLWDPLGMEYPGVWTIDSQASGLEKTWCCLAASARDFAKFGAVYLNGGNWKGQEILPPGWVAASTSSQVPADAWPEAYESIGWHNYGFQWWLASEQIHDYFALGKDGQILYVHPGEDVIILRLGWSTGSITSGEWIRLFQEIAADLG